MEALFQLSAEAKTGRDRSAMGSEVCKRYQVTVLAISCGSCEVDQNPLANALGILRLERLSRVYAAYVPTVPALLHVIEIMRVDLMLTGIRTGRGLGPGIVGVNQLSAGHHANTSFHIVKYGRGRPGTLCKDRPPYRQKR